MKRLLFILMFAPMFGTAQTDATEVIKNKYERYKAYWFYESTLRALNPDENESLEKLINGVDKITAIFVNKAEDNVPATQFADYIQDVKDDDFIELMSMSSKEGKFAMYGDDAEDLGSFVAVMEDESNFIVFDFEGKLKLELLYTLEMADFTALKELVDKQTTK